MPAAGYTRATLTTEVQTDAQDENGDHYTAAYVQARINDRCADFVMRVKCRRHTWQVDIVADQVVYDLTSLAPRAIDIQTVAMPNSAGATDEYELELVTLTELEADYPMWRTEASTWPVRYARFTEGFDGLILHPPAASSQVASVIGAKVATSPYGILVNINGLGVAAATSAYGLTVGASFKAGAMRIDGIAHSTDLATDAATLESAGVPVQYQQAIKAGVLADCYGDLSVPIAQVQKAAQYEAEYEGYVMKARQLVQAGFQGRPAVRTRGRQF